MLRHRQHICACHNYNLPRLTPNGTASSSTLDAARCLAEKARQHAIQNTSALRPNRGISLIMKKLTYKYRNWLRHRQQYCAKRRTLRVQTELILLTQPIGPSWRARAARHNRCMPETLCFNDNCDESLFALADLRKWLHLPMRGTRRGHQVSKHRNARIRQAGGYRSFETLKLVTPAAALGSRPINCLA